MEDVIAVQVRLADGGRRYFLTWGRIQDAVDPEPVCDVVMRFARLCSLGSEPVTARLCSTLREAAESHDAPHFYEALLSYPRSAIPLGNDYDAWRQQRAEAMDGGREIYYCGRARDSGATDHHEPDGSAAGP